MTASAAFPSEPRVGVQLQPQHAGYGQIREAVPRAEDLGVDMIFPGIGGCPGVPLPARALHAVREGLGQARRPGPSSAPCCLG